MLFDKFYNRYVVVGKLKTVTPLHIGAGKSEFNPINVDSSVIRDEFNNPIIPGSTLKGVLRGYLEKIIDEGCMVTESPCVPYEQIKIIKEENKTSKERGEAIYKALCPLCKIFGTNGMASKLQIKDGRVSNLHYKIEERDGISIDRSSEVAADGRKYNFEVVSAGAEFDFYMTIDNLEKEYRYILKIIINLLKEGELKIGGRTSVGLGSVKLIDEKIYFIDKNNMKDYFLKGLKEEMRWKANV